MLKAYLFHKFLPVCCTPMMAELGQTLSRPRILKFLLLAEAEELLNLLDERSEFFEPKNKILVCREPDDDILIALSLESKCPFITLDKDLLVLAGSYNILSPREFLKRL